MRAVVLVGGFGTRLRPLTLDTPKQMLPIGSVTMFERVVARLGGCGVDEVIVSLGFRPDRFVEAFPDGRCAGVALHYAIEPEPLDTAGAIRFAAVDAGIDDTFLVLNGDVLTDLDYRWLVSEHRRLGAEATLHLTGVDEPSRFGVVPTDESARVVAFIEKPAPGTEPTNLVNAGTYVMEPSVLDRIPSGRKVSVERETFPALVADGTLYAVATDDYWIDAGTPAAYLAANLDLIDGTRGSEQGVSPTAEIALGAKVTRAVVGAGAKVSAGAVVEDSVVMAGAVIGPDATVSGSIVGTGATLAAGSAVRAGSVVGHGVHVPEGVELVGATAPDPTTWQ